MRLEIYVVLTELEKKKLLDSDIIGFKCLKEQKEQLIRLFGGLTELDFKGYWRDSEGYTEIDFGKLWLIYTDRIEDFEKFISILERIKAITRQGCLAYAIDNRMFFLEETETA